MIRDLWFRLRWRWFVGRRSLADRLAENPHDAEAIAVLRSIIL